jgi:hypothetical protein
MRRMCSWLTTAALAGCVLGGLAGCKSNDAGKQTQAPDEGSRTGGPAASPKSAPLDPATLGTVSGTIHLSGKAPAPVKIDMSMDPVCSITGGDNFAEQYVVHDGKLANVYVYLKSGPPAAMSATAPMSTPVVMDQVGCKYVPHVVALPRGGSVEFRNSQGPKGTPQVKQFNRPEEMMPVRCNNHPWMNAFINVSATPFFAVTGADGHFSISGLPAGTYTIAAVHEKMGEQAATVTVEPKATAKADFSFSVK